MKKIGIVTFLLIFFSCGSTKPPLLSKPMYDVLFGSDFGGASFQFYEIITEEIEFNMLLKDKIIKPYIKKEDITTCNFILVNIGEKQKNGYTIEVKIIEELSDKIVLTIKEVEPKGIPNESTNPCFVVKIKSKKTIEIK
jgi:hypothetical protein